MDVVVFTYREAVSSGSGMQEVQEEWSGEHAKLLYMISLFAKSARTASEYEGWIRHIPILVLLYEGCIAGVLNFDYAPASLRISQGGVSQRLWLNTSQDGKAAIDDLREKSLVNGLKLSTEDFQPVTAYQASHRGQEFVDQIPQRLKDQVDGFVCVRDAAGALKLLHVEFVSAIGAQRGLSSGEGGGGGGGSGKGDEGVGGGGGVASVMAAGVAAGSSSAVAAAAEAGAGSKTDDGEDSGYFVLCLDSGERVRRSHVTESEDVSYVSSPFLPACVRNARDQRAFSCNEHMAHEAAIGQSNMRDELSESITLGYVTCMVGEWIPFGSNQIVALNERLGAMDRCQGGLFTALVDQDPSALHFECDPGLTEVTILDYDFVHFINFEAEIHYPEDDGIVQIENFGMHLNVDGTVFYGVKVEAIMDRTAESISLDLLSRMLVDVHQDSSLIMDDLLSSYQRAMLDVIFMGDTKNRGKFNMVIADSIEPFLPAAEYMDRDSNENELKQIVGDLHRAVDLGEDGVLIVGRDGLLVAGTNAKDYEPLLVCYLSLLCREMFLRNFFVRIFVVDDLLKTVRGLINDYQSDPNYLARIRVLINDASRDLILLSELVEYIRESLQGMALPESPTDVVGRQLYGLLDVHAQHHDVLLRASDLMKLVTGGEHELQNLQQMCEVINTQQLEGVFKSVEANTKYLVDASAANERSSASLEVMQVILAGSFAFDIVDRLSGGTLNIAVPDWVNIYVTDPVISTPFLWFALNLAWLAVVSYAILKFMRLVQERSNGALTLRVKVNRRIDLKRWHAFLDTRVLEVTDMTSDDQVDLCKVSWFEVDSELWQGEPPKIEALFDRKYSFLLVTTYQVNERNTRLHPLEDELCKVFFGQLSEFGVLEDRGGTSLQEMQRNTPTPR